MNEYTGREIAILTDCHALLEPLQAVLADIKRRNIHEVYSLGDNLGLGPNPSETLNLLLDNNVISLKGNYEEYLTLGIEPFRSYFHHLKNKGRLWTLSKLNEEQIGEINLFPHSIELIVGGKKLALCHFANDVRCDFSSNSTYTYQKNLASGHSYKQFLYTNSEAQREEIRQKINYYGINSPFVKGYLSAMEDPLFNGKMVDFFDAIIQGHVHFKIYEESESTKFYSVRSVGMAYDKSPVDCASYIIIKEKQNGYDIEEVLVRYDREKMISSIISSDNPEKTVMDYTNINLKR